MTDWKLFLAILIPVIGSISTLVGVIWNMHMKRVDALERVMMARMDRSEEERRHVNERLFEKLEEIQKTLAAGSQHFAEKYRPKDECDKLRHECKGK